MAAVANTSSKSTVAIIKMVVDRLATRPSSEVR
jgi:hypothetical protein